MISVAEVRSRVGAGVAPGTLDRVEEVLGGVVADFERGTFARWRAATNLVEVHGPVLLETDVLEPRLRSISTIAEVATREVAVGAEWKVLDATSYELLGAGAPETAILRLDGKSWRGRFVRVRATGGYGVAAGEQTLPEDVREAIILETKFRLARDASDKVAVGSLAGEGASTSLLSARSHPRFAETVGRYRRLGS